MIKPPWYKLRLNARGVELKIPPGILLKIRNRVTILIITPHDEVNRFALSQENSSDRNESRQARSPELEQTLIVTGCCYSTEVPSETAQISKKYDAVCVERRKRFDDKRDGWNRINTNEGGRSEV